MTSTSSPHRKAVGGLAAFSLAATAAAVAGTMLLAHSAAATGSLAVTGYAEEGTATSAIDASAAAMTTPGVDGINIDSSGASTPAPDSGAIALLNKAHADHLRAEFLIGNYSNAIGDFDSTALDKLLNSPGNINNVVATVVNAVASQGWDGVTIDFEAVLSQDAQGLVDFATALKHAMPAGKTVSIDVTAYQTATEYTDNGYDLSALGAAVDRVVLMAYDEHGPTWNGVGPIGGLPWQETCLKQLLTQVPAAKVDLGVAGYGYTWPATGTGVTVSDAQARQMVAADGSTATWDSTQGEWTATLNDGTVLWWSDAKSWPLRVALAQKYALHGMALWSLGLSDPLQTTAAGGGIDPSKWYEVVNTNSGLCVDARSWGTSNGTAVQQWSCGSGQHNQEWQFQSTGNGYYRVINRNAPGEVWDVTGGQGATSNGTPIELWSATGGTNQQWLPKQLSSGAYTFSAKNSGKCLDVTNRSTSSGTQLQQWSCTSGDNAQSFQLIPEP